jgi:hypothetical protein
MAEERISLREYGRRKGVSDTAVRKAIHAGKIVEGVVKDKSGKPWIIQEIADREWSSNHNPVYERTVKSGKPNAAAVAQKEPDAPGVPESGGNATLAAAKRAKAVFDAKLAELSFKEKSGSLVRKDEVYRALYAFGQSVRSAIQAVPDRVIDDVLSAGSRNEAHLLLQKALDEALLKLAEGEKIQFVR